MTQNHGVMSEQMDRKNGKLATGQPSIRFCTHVKQRPTQADSPFIDTFVMQWVKGTCTALQRQYHHICVVVKTSLNS